MKAKNREARDYLGSYSNSAYLARKIEGYWHTRGFKQVRVWVVTEDFNDAPLYVIRSENIPLNDVA